MILFDGVSFAQKLEKQIKQSVDQLQQKGLKLPSIHTLVFKEDAPGLTYTQLKSEACSRVGIEYNKHEYTFLEDQNFIIEHINKLNQDASCTAILVQKPRRKMWVKLTGQSLANFDFWWRKLVQTIDPNKDVDGLHPDYTYSLGQQAMGSENQIWPATARAVWLILNEASRLLMRSLAAEKMAIVGVSDLLGLPLSVLLKQHKINVRLLSHYDFDALVSSGHSLVGFTTVISATGQPNLIDGQMLSPNSILVDVGEPKPDFNFISVSPQAAFIAPVPGGVGPVTVSCLLQNAVDLLTV